MTSFFSDNDNWNEFKKTITNYISKNNTYQAYYITGTHGIGKTYRTNLVCSEFHDSYDIININTSSFDDMEDSNIEDYLDNLINSQNIRNILSGVKKRKLFIIDELECVTNQTFNRLNKAYKYFISLIENPSFQKKRHIFIFIGNLMVVKIEKKNINHKIHFKMNCPTFEEATTYVMNSFESKINTFTINSKAIEKLCKYYYKDIYQLNHHIDSLNNMQNNITISLIDSYLSSNNSKNEDLHIYQTVISLFCIDNIVQNIHNLSFENTINIIISMLGENFIKIFQNNSVSKPKSKLKSKIKPITILNKNLLLDQIKLVSHYITYYDYVKRITLNNDENDIIPVLSANVMLLSIGNAVKELGIENILLDQITFPQIPNRKSLRTTQRFNFQKIAIISGCYSYKNLFIIKNYLYSLILLEKYEELEQYLRSINLINDQQLFIQLLRLDKINTISISNINKIKNKLKITDLIEDEN